MLGDWSNFSQLNSFKRSLVNRTFCRDGGLLPFYWLTMDVFCPQLLSNDDVLGSRDHRWLFDYCLTVYNGRFLEYPTIYSTWSLEEILLFVAIFFTDPLMAILNIRVKDPFLIADNKSVQKVHLNLCTQQAPRSWCFSGDKSSGTHFPASVNLSDLFFNSHRTFV